MALTRRSIAPIGCAAPRATREKRRWRPPRAVARNLLNIPMQFTSELRRLLDRGGDAPLDEDEAARLWGAILDDAVDHLDVGAMVATLAVAGETRDEIAGLHRAARERLAMWTPQVRRHAVAIPVYGLVPGETFFAALAAMLLRRFGMTVIVHGILDSPCGLSAASVLRELGVWPCRSFAEADERLASDDIAFVPVQLLSPAFASLLALRGRFGVSNTAHRVAQSLVPVTCSVTRLAFCIEPGEGARAPAFDAEGQGDCVALAWRDGTSPLNLSLRPRIERIAEGERELLFGGDAQETRSAVLPPPGEAIGMARWIERVTSGAVPVPVPALSLVAACLYAVGEAPDLSRAKAIAAIHAGRLAA
jgi:anthranilate phosphoribosyltransferase